MSTAVFRDAADSSMNSLGNDKAGEEQGIWKILRWMLESEASNSETDWRSIAAEDYRFYAGDQDNPEVRAELEIQRRPTNTYNTIMPKVNMLCGLAAQSNRTPYVFPVSVEDEALTELMNGAFKHYRRGTKAQRKENECFEHSVKSGRSFLAFYVGGENPFQPKIEMKRVPGRDVLMDPMSVEYDMSDARYIFVSKWMFEDDIKLFWPDFPFEDVRNLATGDVMSQDIPLFYNYVTRKYRITECWYRKVIQVMWFNNPFTNQIESLPVDEFKKFEKAAKEGFQVGEKALKLPEGFKIKSIPRAQKRVHYMTFSGTYVIDEGQSPYKHNYFPYVLYGAYKSEEDNRWFSAITMMKDPQKGRNAMRRQLLHLLNTSPKGLLVHEAGALINEEEYDQKSSEPNFRLVVKDLSKYKFTDQPQISPVYAQLDSVFEQDMKDTSGAQDSLLGIQTSSREPGITVRMRQETGIAVLYSLFANFRESRLQGGRILMSMIQQYCTEPQLIRFEGAEGQQLLQMNTQLNPQLQGFNDISAADNDLAIDEAVENNTMRMAIAQMLTEYSQNNPGTIPPDLIMEYSDMPFSVQQRVKQYTAMMMQREDEYRQAQLETQREVASTKAIADIRKNEVTGHSRERIAKHNTENRNKQEGGNKSKKVAGGKA